MVKANGDSLLGKDGLYVDDDDVDDGMAGEGVPDEWEEDDFCLRLRPSLCELGPVPLRRLLAVEDDDVDVDDLVPRERDDDDDCFDDTGPPAEASARCFMPDNREPGDSPKSR